MTFSDVDIAPNVVDQEYWAQLPQFPEDTIFAPLEIISYEKILANDHEEINKLLSVSSTLGFFYLDLQYDETLLENINAALNTTKGVFDLSLEEKMKDTLAVNRKMGTFGYKPMGLSAVDKDGNKDNAEHYFVGCRDILGVGTRTNVYNDVLNASFGDADLGRFTTNMQRVSENLLSALGTALEMDTEEFDTLKDFHKISPSSQSMVRLLKYPPRPEVDTATLSLLPHTDFGTLTLIWSAIGGLQVYVEEKGWTWVKPLRGHAIVNLGDSLVKMSNGKLQSSIHRVIPAPGEQSKWTRYGIGYFLRPDDGVLLRTLRGGKIDPPNTNEKPTLAGEWISKRMQDATTLTFDSERWTKSTGSDNKNLAKARAS